jgi:hypothetical protein
MLTNRGADLQLLAPVSNLTAASPSQPGKAELRLIRLSSLTAASPSRLVCEDRVKLIPDRYPEHSGTSSLKWDNPASTSFVGESQ